MREELNNKMLSVNIDTNHLDIFEVEVKVKINKNLLETIIVPYSSLENYKQELFSSCTSTIHDVQELNKKYRV